MIERCSTCKWWGAETGESNLSPDTHALVRNMSDERRYFSDDDRKAVEAEIAARVRRCKSPRVLFYEAPLKGEAAVIDGSEYAAELITDADFGCTLWEAGPTDG